MSTKVSTDLIDLSSNTGGLVWAKGTTAQQPASATAGEMRVDTTTATTLVYNGTQWKTLKETAFVVPPVSTQFLVVGGGGGAGFSFENGATSGAGGAGGLTASSLGISLATAYTITVGEGGLGSTAANARGTSGGITQLDTNTVAGGGGGGSSQDFSGQQNGGSGGSGGGGAGNSGTTTGGSGTAGQGNDGGDGEDSAGSDNSGGGGGAGGAGGTATSAAPGIGGSGSSSSITGSSITYAGGGGGADGNGNSGGTASGGGGSGANVGTGAGNSGTFNTGGGAGGSSNGNGAAGGSGVVILRYPTADLPYFTTTGTLNTPSATDTVADVAYPVTNTAYYKLDSNANDSGLGSGYIGQGAIFNGSSSYIELDGALANGNTGNFSISMWVKIPNSSSQYRLFATDISPYYSKLAINIETNGTLRAAFGNGTSQEAVVYTTTSTWGNNTWQHLTYTMSWNGTNFDLKFYHNGVLDSSHTTGSTAISVLASSKFILGGVYRQDNATYYPSYLGTIDQVRIYNTALSSSNVALLYAETSATSSTLNYPTGTGGQALYEFSGNADSTSSSAYNGTATDVLYAYNGIATDVTYGNGRFNEAANFNGSSSYIQSTLNYSTLPTNNAWSVSCWLKIANTSQTSTAISLMNSSSGFDGWALFIEAGKIMLANNGSTPGASTGSFPVYSANTWVHVVLNYNGSGVINIYYNGNQAATVNGTISTSTNGNFRIGYAGVWSYFNGSVDQVRIFSSALAPGDVEDLYNEHFPTKFTDGSDTALMFTGGTGDITFLDANPNFTADYLVVAGGGSGGGFYRGGGGGAGGLRTSYGSTTGGGGNAETALPLSLSTNYNITVGVGGTANANAVGSNGTNTTFATVTSTGGGGGGIYTSSTGTSGTTGGSGGGGGGDATGGAGGAAVTSPVVQGYAGGTGASSNIQCGGGGGGASAVGQGGGTGTTDGDGGDGIQSTILSYANAGTASVGEQISGSEVWYGGGGASGSYGSGNNATPGKGGGGDGTHVGTYPGNGTAGTANTGGGGGGASGESPPSSGVGGAGGSGFVILRYPNAYSITIGAGLTQSTGSPFTEGTDKISVFTAGAGTITFS
jgi:hypothetical protein